jgi:hypothetical protein
MSIVRQSIGIKEAFKLIKKIDDPCTPVIEGMINSLDSIKQRQKLGDSFTPGIIVSIYYETPQDLFEKDHSINSITIEDNGIGFISDNLSRFKHLGDGTKNLKNRGTGKIQFFYRFNKIVINSVFKENEKYKELDLTYTINDDLTENVKEKISPSEMKTVVKMESFSGTDKEKKFFRGFFTDVDLLKKIIFKRSLFLRLYLERSSKLVVTFKIYVDKSLQNETSISEKDIPSLDKTVDVSINTVCPVWNKSGKIEWETVKNDVLKIDRFKLCSTDIDKNSIYLCSKNILIEKFSFPLLKDSTDFSGFRYITCISGNILDENIRPSMDGFTFSDKKQIEDDIKNGDFLRSQKEYIFYDEIKKKIDDELCNVYSDVKNLKEEKEKSRFALARNFGISEEIAKEVKVDLDDSKEDITKKLFESQGECFAEKSIEIHERYHDLKKLEIKTFDPTNKEYETKFRNLSAKLLTYISEQDKNELARYIIRRDMVVELLRLALKNELLIQKEWKKEKESGNPVKEKQESLIHDLIFKRKTIDRPNDLWILNEEFVHFSSCSDLPLNEIEVNGSKLLKSDINIEEACRSAGLEIEHRLKQRPDIFIFPEEGKCVLIEFKAPNIKLDLHLDQISRYAKLIANYSEKQINQFYGFLIGESINKIDIPDRYRKPAYGNYWFYPNEPVRSIDKDIIIADMYQEIIPLSAIADRAEIRNRSFAEKLGIVRQKR